MIVLDTSAIYAFLNARDTHFGEVARLLQKYRDPYILPVAVLGELALFLETKHPDGSLDRFLGALESGDYLTDWHPGDIARTRELAHRYRSLSLGFTDSSVIACAERLNAAVLTLDFRHFPVVAREGTFKIAE